jgi:hypothetical protein
MITIDVNTSEALGWFDRVSHDQLPFAMSKALNATATDFQVAERAHLREIFTLRRETWADRSIKITHFAKKTELWAKIAVAPPPSRSGGDNSDIFGKFEDETIKLPHNGHRALVIPLDAKRTGAGVVSESIKPGALHFRRISTSGAATIYRGDKKTFMVQTADGRGFILQRTGPGLHGDLFAGSSVLFVLRPSAPIKPDLHFESTGQQVVDEMFFRRFDEAWERALETAR